MTTIHAVKVANPGWFTLDNKRFFNDVTYQIVHGGLSNMPFLVRSTYAWTDMFGQEPRLYWCINRINPETLKIEGLLDEEFASLEAVQEFLEEQ